MPLRPGLTKVDSLWYLRSVPADRAVDPIQALEWCTEKLNPRSPETFSPGEAPRGFLAADVDLSTGVAPDGAGIPRRPVAARNGYAVAEETRKDGVYTFLGTIAAGGQLYGPEGSRLPSRADPPPGTGTSSGESRGIWRVETGAPMPSGTDRVVPVSGGLLLGGERLRLQSTVAAAAGVDPAPPLPRAALVVPAGSRLDERLRSLLLAHGVQRVRVRSAYSVGYGSIGDELIDLTVAGTVEPGQTRDVSGYWLGDAIAGCGQKAVALGILPDEPRRIREVVHRCRRRHLEVAVLSGGVGHGFTDRVVESLRQMDARILFTEVTLNGGLGFVLAKTQGVDVLVLCGQPLWCAALFDLFVGPALRARAGAARVDWDWTRREQLLQPVGLEESAPEYQDAWGLFPALPVAGSGGGLRVPPAAATPSAFPWLPGQCGWIVTRSRGDKWEPVFFASASRGAGVGT